ncbi:MAG: head GIN domain-containing protein [Ferruginibacter sp.]
MKKILFSIMAVLVVGITAAQKVVVDENAQQRTLNSSFTAIKVSGSIDLYLSQYETESVAVSASEEKYRDNIKTEVENGVLKIYYDGDKIFNWKNKKLKAYVSFKNLEKLNASGASDVLVSGTITVPSLFIDCSGASDFKGAVKVNDLKIELSGASDAKISGTASNVKVHSSGASDVKGYELVTDYCDAEASGASDINITVNKEINVHASGASDIFFKGEGVIKDIHSSGASTVSRKS